MALEQYVALANVTLTSASSSVTFSSITQEFRDLVLIANFSVSATGSSYLRLNNDSASNYFRTTMYGYVCGTGSGSTSSANLIAAGYVESGNSGMFTFNFLDTSATDKHKVMLGRLNEFESTLATNANAQRWANTNVITSILVARDTGNFEAGSTFTLYGVR